MLTSIFQNVLLLSGIGGVVGVLWLLLKPLTRKKFSPKWQYYIWLTVLVVMVLPVSFSLPQSTDTPPTFGLAVQNTEIKPQTTVALEEVEKPIISVMPTEIIRSVYVPQASRKTVRRLSDFWLFGVLSFLVYRLAKYTIFCMTLYKNSVKSSERIPVPKRLCVRRTSMLDAPLIIGLLKPTLYLPIDEIDQTDMHYILQHEITHYKRHDLIYKWFAMLVESIHWFNPIVYLVVKQIDEECEVYCDWEVTNGLSDSERNRYMNMILDMAAKSNDKERMLTTHMASDKTLLRARFFMIRNCIAPRKATTFISVLITVMVFGTAVFAGGVLANELLADDFVVTVRNGNEPLTFESRPFMKNNVVYLPVRETFDKFNYNTDYISWRQTSAGALKNNNGHLYEQVAPDSRIDEVVMYVPDEYIEESGKQSDANWNYLRVGADEHIVNGYSCLSFAGNGCIVRNGVIYAPYSFFEYCKNTYKNMLPGLNMTLSKSDKAIRFDTDINPYFADEQTALTLDDLVVISLNGVRWAAKFSYADFAGFISDEKEENVINYPINEEYVLRLEAQPDGNMIPWLWNIPFQNGKNLNGIRFDGTDPANEWNKQHAADGLEILSAQEDMPDEHIVQDGIFVAD